MRLALVVASLLALPRVASAAPPEITAELGVSAENNPADTLVGWAPRLSLRLDDDPLSTYARVGLTVPTDGGNEPDGYAVDGAVGIDGRLCTGRLCGGLRLGVGLQYADLLVEEERSALSEEAQTTALFAELGPHVALGPVGLELDLRVHHTTSHDGLSFDAQPYHFAASLSLSLTF